MPKIIELMLKELDTEHSIHSVSRPIISIPHKDALGKMESQLAMPWGQRRKNLTGSGARTTAFTSKTLIPCGK